MATIRCAFTGCPIKVDKQGHYCSIHQPVSKARNIRLGSHYKGYNHKWRRYRARYLRVNPLCNRCGSFGKTSLATVVDHIKPCDNDNDPLFYEPTNHQPLCRDCHAWKTRVIDRRGFGVRRHGGSARA